MTRLKTVGKIICMLLFTLKAGAQVINYNESVSGDISNTAASNAFTLNTAGVHTWTCTLEPTPFPGGVDRFQVVVPTGFVITSYTYNLTSLVGVDVTHGFDATLSYTPNTVGTGTTNNSINYTFPTPKPAGTYDIETVGNFVPSNRPYTVTVTTAAVGTPFITTWNLATAGGGANQIQFNAGTTGAVNYTWTGAPSGTSGSGTFTAGVVTIAGFTANDVITFKIAPTNFKSIKLLIQSDFNRLTNINQWGSVAWNTMEQAFSNCQNLNISATDLPNLAGVTNMTSMFTLCQLLNGPSNINFWNISSLTSIYGMFEKCTIFNQPLNNWNVSNVTNMAYIFQDAREFNQPLNNWVVSNGINLSGVFLGAHAFNQPLNNWNVSSATNMFDMFNDALAFKQNLGSWTLNPSVNMGQMLNNNGMNCSNYSATLQGWATNNPTVTNRNLGASGRRYGASAVASRNTLATTRGWTITGDALVAAPTASTTQTFCSGATVSSIVATGSGIQWYAVPTGGAVLAGGTTLVNGTTYYGSQTVGGCESARRAVTVSVSNITSSISAQTNVLCFGGSNGTATVTPSGGTPSYTYSWSPSGGTAATASGRSAGAYSCLITDANGCTRTQNITITQPAALSTSISAQTNVSCFGGSNGVASINTPSGGAGGNTYNWTPGNPTGDGTTSISGLTAGTWTCTVTDANSCTTSQTFTISQPSALGSTSSQTNVSCNGGSNGTATITPSGGSPSYTYSWAPSGGTAATASGLTAGTYTCTITNFNGCTRTQNVTITQPTLPLDASNSQANVSCNGGSDGLAIVFPSGGTPGYTFAWAPSGGTTSAATGLVAGSYVCTITDANNCTSTESVIITQPTALGSTSSRTNVSCNGGSNGTATVTPSGGTPGYTYSWSPNGGTAATATGLVAGSYVCTITDGYGCTRTQSETITQPTALGSTSSKFNVSCNGGSNGTAIVTPSDGTPSYTYSWSPSVAASATAIGLVAGSYVCTMTDANGCTTTQTFTITQPSALGSTSSQTNVYCNGGSNGTATVTTTGGTASYTYSWSPSGGTAATASGLIAGSYVCTITDANGCTRTQSVTITQPSPLGSTSSQTNVTCNGGSNGTATVTPSGGTPSYTYSWFPSGGTAATASGLSAGYYTCIIIDAKGCSAFQDVTITQPSSALTATYSQTNVTCNGGSNGSATVLVTGGTGTYTYNWSPSGGTASTATGLSAGSYVCTVTDANSCTQTQNVTITQPSALGSISSQTNVSCNGGSNGTATVTPSGGTPSYTYSWSPSGGTAATATGLVAGSYVCTITDANSCTRTQNVTITQPTALGSTSSQTNVSCNGGSNGTATITPSGGSPSYTYSWAPSGGTAATATGLVAGSYVCTITDANGCTRTQSVTITEPTALTSSILSQTNVSCFGGSNGAASINTPSGGAGGYTYNWTPGNPTGDGTTSISGLTAGTWTCTVTDANSCTTVQTFTITQPAGVVVSANSQTNISCFSGNNGIATVIPSGGTPSYTYSWAPSGGTSSTATGLSAGSYVCTITDANGCTRTQSVTITEPLSLTSTGSQTNVSCFGGSNGAATVTPSGGTAGYTYSWSPSGGTAATASGLSAGTYICTITDANGCIATRNVTVTEPAVLAASISSQTNVSCNAGSNASVTVLPTGGSGAYTYSWSPSGGTAATASGLSAGNYACLVTDANNCTATQSVTITQPSFLAASISSQTNLSCNAGLTGSVTVTPTGGTAGYTYFWSPSGGTTATANGLVAGNYSCLITDANGCTTTQIATITEPTVLVSTISAQTNVSCNAGSNGLVTVSATGGTGSYSYSWSPSGGTTATASGLVASNYACLITDANNCSTTQNVIITEPTVLVSTISAQTNVSCNAGSNGTATLTPTGGTPGYTYSWAPSGGTSATASGLIAGNYACLITDINNCATTQNVTITEPTVLTSSISAQTNVSCNAGSNASVTVSATGGTSTYTYSWSPSGGTAATATGLSVGNYTCLVTDANNCTTTQNVTITEPTVLTASIASQTNVSCNGGSNASVTVLPTGGTGTYTYSWSPSGVTAATATALNLGNYTCLVTDANNCTTTQNVTITQPTVLASSISTQTNVSCNAGSNGSVTVSATGGTGIYTYSWSPSGGTAATATGLVADNYACLITDANNCTTTQNVTITQPTDLASSISTQTNVSCNAGSNGSVTVLPTGGTGAYTYSWSPSGGTAATASGLVAGNYACLITDANNCTTAQNVTIAEPTVLASSISSQTNVSCNAGSNASVTVSATGGTGTYTYAWSPSGGTAATSSGLVAGTYACLITDANGCSTTQNATITQPTALTTVIAANNTTICLGNNELLTSTVSGGTSPYAYAWSSNETSTSISVNPTSDATITLTVTDANGCTASNQIALLVVQNPTISLDALVEIKLGDSYSLNPTIGGATTFEWTPSTYLNNATIANPITTPEETISYVLTATSINGCVTSDNITITVLSNLFFANYMSPNGDGQNDTWKVNNPYLIKDYKVDIIDSYGQTVYSIDQNYNNEFDGTKNGENLPDGAYYYFVREGETVKHKGNFSLTR